jgi:PHD/YefM family antitoxin component YafN of YafNO toxin-antitoxin module
MDERDKSLFIESLIVKLYRSYLYEEYHIVTTFDDCIEYIITNIDQFQKRYLYTGWNYDCVNKKCLRLNDIKKYYPIYVKIIYNSNNDNIMSSVNRDMNNISLNHIYITINLKNEILSNKTISKSILAHEFRHCLEMYVTNFNTIKDDTYYDIKYKPYMYIIQLNDFLHIKETINLFSTSEERARIDAVIHYIKYNNIKCENNVNEVAKIIQKTDNLSYLKDMSSMIDFMYGKMHAKDYKYFIVLGYLCKNHMHLNNKISKTIKISEDDINNFENLDKQYLKVQTENLIYVFSENYSKFITLLKDCILYHSNL